ncbi:MAG: ABC transporter [Ruminococcaceae bacterium]|nr:ABC transporter [Oscillospiraceae bacterium]
MIAIMKRDLRSFFTSPIGYVVLAAFLLFCNFFFYSTNIQGGASSLSYVFNNMLLILVFLIPLVTMRLMSEEMKQRTDQMLLTAPVRVVDIVVGKYLSAMMVFVIALACTFTWPLIVTMFGDPAVYEIIGNYVAMTLLISCLVSVGIFISSLTESQIIAAILSFIVMIALFMFSSIASAVDNVVVSAVLNWLSVFSRYSGFTAGVFSLADVVYYISVTVVFLFLTTRVIEKKRWA